MPANTRMPVTWSRRSLLVALATGSVTAVTVLSGCRVQLEEDAPRVPLVPTRAPMKDEKALLAVLGRAGSLRSLARGAGGSSTSMTRRLSAVHATQIEVIASLLRDGGVPESLIGIPPGKASHATAAALSAAEGSSMSDISPADLSKTHVVLIGSLLAQRAAAVTLLGGTAALAVPAGAQGGEALRLLAAVRASVYGFEVVAAQIGTTGRALAMSTLEALGTHLSDLEKVVGSTGGPRPLGYELPFPVTGPRSARRLALHLLAALLTSQTAALEPATGDPAALATIVQWLGVTEALASRWGAPLAAFPGLTGG